MSGMSAGGPVVLATDEPGILEGVREALRADGATVVACRTSNAALQAIDFHRPLALVVDVAMEEGRGWELLFDVVQRRDTAILALDRSGDALVRRGALSAGADDVVTAPMDPEEAVARLRALIQRQEEGPRGGPVYRHGDLLVDVPAHEVRVAGRRVHLTPQQFAVLRALCEAAGATLHRSQLVARIAAVDDEPPSDRAIDLHVSRLRARLGVAGRQIEAVYGVGYRLAPSRTQPTADAHAAAVLEALPDALLVLDERLTITAVNRSAEIALGRPRAELIGRSCAEVMDCRTVNGSALAGPGCPGRVASRAEVAIRDARAVVNGPDGPRTVVFSHIPVLCADGSRSLAVSIRSDRP